MPGSFIEELILQPIFELVFHVVAYYLGRLVVPVVSLGRWKCDPMTREVPKNKLRWGGLYHLCGQQVYLTPEATSIVGLLSSGLVIGLALWWHFSA
jgi:hypothetical protein